MRRLFLKIPLESIRFFLFFSVFFLYTALRIDPRLIYHGYGIHGQGLMSFPVFLRSAEFFREHLAYPGGLLDYFSGLLTQYYYYRFFGSFVIVGSVMILCIGGGMVFSTFKKPVNHLFLYIPVLLALVSLHQYANFITIIIGLSIPLFLYRAYAATTGMNSIYRSVVIILFSSAIYYTVGIFFLVFAVLCSIDEFAGKRNVYRGIISILSVILIPYIFNIHFFDYPIGQTVGTLFPFKYFSTFYTNSVYALWGLCLFYPFMALLHHFRLKPAGEKSGRKTRKHRSKFAGAFFSTFKKIHRSILVGNRRILFDSLVLLLIAAVVVIVTYDGKRRSLYRINYLSRTRQWETLLVDAMRIPVGHFSIIINHEVNKALYHTGRLLSDMFSYPQTPNGFLSAEYDYLDLIPRCDTYYYLGFINHAERQAHEALEMIGEYPAILQRLFTINMAKGNTDAAIKYLHVLQQDVIYGRWASDTLELTRGNQLESQNTDISIVKSVITTTDHNRFFYPLEERLPVLIEENKENRMAFEYLMAFCLLTGQVERIAQNIPLMRGFNYTAVPRHFEEALFIYKLQHREIADKEDIPMSNATILRGRKFFSIVQTYGRNINMVKKQINAEFGDSYFFYYIFNYSGVKR